MIFLLCPFFFQKQNMFFFLFLKCIKAFLKMQFLFLGWEGQCTVPYSMWDLSSLTRDRTHMPHLGSAESLPLGLQISPIMVF